MLPGVGKKASTKQPDYIRIVRIACQRFSNQMELLSVLDGILVDLEKTVALSC